VSILHSVVISADSVPKFVKTAFSVTNVKLTYLFQNDPLNCAGGGATFSSNDPLFFLHHANIDRIWALWQEAHPANKKAFSGGSVESSVFDPMGLPPMLSKTSPMPTSGLFPVKTVGDVMDTTGGYLCYRYV
jgi:tyrosinase